MAVLKPLALVPGGQKQIASTDQIAVDAGAMTVTETGSGTSRALPDLFADKVAYRQMTAGTPWETVNYNTLNKTFDTKFVNGPASSNGPDPAYSLHYYLGFGGGDNVGRGAQMVMTDKDGGTLHYRAKSGSTWGPWSQAASLASTTSALALKTDKVSLEGFFNPLDFGDGRAQMLTALEFRDLTACFNTAFNSGFTRWRIPGGDYPIRTFSVTGQVNAAVYVKKNISIYIEGEPGCRIIAGKGLPEVSSGLWWFQTDTIAPSSILSPPNSLAVGGRHTNKVTVKGITFDGTELSAQNGRSTGTGLTFLKIYNYVNPEVCHCNFIGGFAATVDGFNPLGLGNLDQGLSTHSCMNAWVHHCYFEGIYDVACYPNGTYIDPVTTQSPLRCTRNSTVVTVYHPAHGYTTGQQISITQGNTAFNINPVGGPYTITRLTNDTYSFTQANAARDTGSFGGTVVITPPGGGSVTLQSPIRTVSGSNVVTVNTAPNSHGLAVGDSINLSATGATVGGLGFGDIPLTVATVASPTQFTVIGRNTSNAVANATATTSGGDTVTTINVSGSEDLANSDNGNGFLLEHSRFYRVGAPCQFKRGMQRSIVRFCLVDTAVSGFRAGNATGAVYGGRQVIHDCQIRNILGSGIVLHGPDSEAYNNIIENFGKLPGGRMFTAWKGVPAWAEGSVYYAYVAGSFPTQMTSVVSFGGKNYYCVTGHTATSTFDTAKFVALDTLSTWTANTAYTAGTLLITGSASNPGNYVLRVMTDHTSGSSLRDDNAAGKIIYMSTHVRNEDSPMGAIVGFAAPKGRIRKNTITQKDVWAYPASYWPASPLRGVTLSGSNDNTYGSVGCDVEFNTITGVPSPFYETGNDTSLGDPQYGTPCDYNTFRDNSIVGARSTSGVMDNRIVGANSTVGSTMVFAQGAGFSYTAPSEALSPLFTYGATGASGPYNVARSYVQGTVWGFQTWTGSAWGGALQFNQTFVRLQQPMYPAGTTTDLGTTANYFQTTHTRNVKIGPGMSIVTSQGSNPADGTATWTRGDRVINSLPSVGQPKGWICTASGTPGTWVSEGNL